VNPQTGQQHAPRPSPGPLPARTPSATPAPSPRPTAPPHSRLPRRPVIPPVNGRCASTELPREPISPHIARAITLDALRAWDREDISEETLIVVSELVTNAVIAAVPAPGNRPAILFAIHYKPPEIRMYVWDNGPGKPEPAAPGNDAEGGRGLELVDYFTRRNWEWWPTPHSGGKVVRATVTMPAPGPPG
jgi:anti-sigma regulatory factor (Ser/Thr protein kinase)